MTMVNYPNPVTVNGYSCKTCTDVDYAKQHIDPAHPKDGPYGVDAKTQPPSAVAPSPRTPPSPAVILGGALAGLPQTAGGQALVTQRPRLDVAV
ncbi:MAG: hypothetical protein ACHP9T_16185 [Caulobacterales bacterium]|jgi:hypothetical protein